MCCVLFWFSSLPLMITWFFINSYPQISQWLSPSNILNLLFMDKHNWKQRYMVYPQETHLLVIKTGSWINNFSKYRKSYGDKMHRDRLLSQSNAARLKGKRLQVPRNNPKRYGLQNIKKGKKNTKHLDVLIALLAKGILKHLEWLIHHSTDKFWTWEKLQLT